MVLMSQADEYGTKHCEHIRLNEGHQQLQCVHKQKHEDAEDVEPQTITYSHRPTEENHTGKRKYYCVTSHHVGEKSDHQSKWLGEYSEQFDGRHHART